MEQFISLEEFLLLKNPTDREPQRPLNHLENFVFSRDLDRGYEILQRYKLAKISFEKYSNEGPPVDTQIVTLMSGHGGSSGLIRRFGGIYVDDSRFFELSYQNEYYNQSTDIIRRTLCQRKYWWAEIVPEELVDWSRGKLVIKE